MMLSRFFISKDAFMLFNQNYAIQSPQARKIYIFAF